MKRVMVRDLHGTKVIPMAQPIQTAFCLALVQFPGLTPQREVLGKSFREAEGRLGEKWGGRVMPASAGPAWRLKGEGLPDICTFRSGLFTGTVSWATK